MYSRRHAASARVLMALMIFAAAGAVFHFVEDARERGVARADRAKKTRQAEDIAALRAMPTSLCLRYESIVPVDDPAPLNRKIRVRSSATRLCEGAMTNHDVLRCVDAGATPDLRYWVSEVQGKFPPRPPGTMGDVEAIEGVEHHAGYWLYGGDRPDGDADCVIDAYPCVILKAHGVEVPKCSPIRSAPIRLRVAANKKPGG